MEVNSAHAFFKKYGLEDPQVRIDQNLLRAGIQSRVNIKRLIKNYNGLPIADQYAVFVRLLRGGDRELLKNITRFNNGIFRYGETIDNFVENETRRLNARLTDNLFKPKPLPEPDLKEEPSVSQEQLMPAFDEQQLANQLFERYQQFKEHQREEMQKAIGPGEMQTRYGWITPYDPLKPHEDDKEPYPADPKDPIDSLLMDKLTPKEDIKWAKRLAIQYSLFSLYEFLGGVKELYVSQKSIPSQEDHSDTSVLELPASYYENTSLILSYIYSGLTPPWSSSIDTFSLMNALLLEPEPHLEWWDTDNDFDPLAPKREWEYAFDHKDVLPLDPSCKIDKNKDGICDQYQVGKKKLPINIGETVDFGLYQVTRASENYFVYSLHLNIASHPNNKDSFNKEFLNPDFLKKLKSDIQRNFVWATEDGKYIFSLDLKFNVVPPNKYATVVFKDDYYRGIGREWLGWMIDWPIVITHEICHLLGLIDLSNNPLEHGDIKNFTLKPGYTILSSEHLMGVGIPHDNKLPQNTLLNMIAKEKTHQNAVAAASNSGHYSIIDELPGLEQLLLLGDDPISARERQQLSWAYQRLRYRTDSANARQRSAFVLAMAVIQQALGKKQEAKKLLLELKDYRPHDARLQKEIQRRLVALSGSGLPTINSAFVRHENVRAALEFKPDDGVLNVIKILIGQLTITRLSRKKRLKISEREFYKRLVSRYPVDIGFNIDYMVATFRAKRSKEALQLLWDGLIIAHDWHSEKELETPDDLIDTVAQALIAGGVDKSFEKIVLRHKDSLPDEMLGVAIEPILEKLGSSILQDN